MVLRVRVWFLWDFLGFVEIMVEEVFGVWLVRVVCFLLVFMVGSRRVVGDSILVFVFFIRII